MKLLGKVKFFNEVKGWGFIKEDDSDAEYFCHISDILEPIAKDQMVEFELENGYNGKVHAVSVKRI